MEQCPQEGKGCEVLVVDFSTAIFAEFDSDHTRAAFTEIGCKVLFVAPKFLAFPQPKQVVVVDSLGNPYLMRSEPTQATIDRVIQRNRVEWNKVKTAVAQHRSRLREGRDLGLQLVNGHANRNACGSWDPGFVTGGGSLYRHLFHNGNYLSARGNTCNTVADDWACYGSLTAMVIGELNNTGKTNGRCMNPSWTNNHKFHASYYGDISTSITRIDTCSNFSIFFKDGTTAAHIKEVGKYGQYERLANSYRNPSAIGSVGFYRDGGYNRRAGSLCTNARHGSLF
jgi:hypothetical protein